MTKNSKRNTRTIRLVFGIFMIVLYCLMGGMFCFTDIFDQVPPLIRKIGGGILIAYGFWRGYRHFAGLDYYTGSRLEDAIEKDEEYSTYDEDVNGKSADKTDINTSENENDN